MAHPPSVPKPRSALDCEIGLDEVVVAYASDRARPMVVLELGHDRVLCGWFQGDSTSGYLFHRTWHLSASLVHCQAEKGMTWSP